VSVLRQVHAAVLAAGLAAAALAACATTKPTEPDRTAYIAHMPRSILVLPPLEVTPVADAPYEWLGSITRPLVEQGYYVFPVALVDLILKENGLPTPGEMHQVSLRKLGEVFGADAVLYVTLQDWGTSYEVLDSVTTVSIEARLVDVKTGVEIWKGQRTVADSSGSGSQSSIAGMLAAAIAYQVSTSVSDPSPALARRANWEMVHDETQGLMIGPLHPGFAEDQAKHAAAAAAPAAPAANAP